MLFRISHATRYAYSRPVFLEPHTLRLRPKSGSSQRLLHYSLDIDPEPVVLTEAEDSEGNDVAIAWFEGTTDHLIVRVGFEVQTRRGNPFDYLPADLEQSRLPLKYPDPEQRLLQPYLASSSNKDGIVGDFAFSIAKDAGLEALPFLHALNGEIYRAVRVENRDYGDPISAEETLKSRVAACRDVAVLFVESCRQMGIAARFVSGYQEGDLDSDDHQMHAWADVYLPGGGWRGYDPTLGLAVADRHIVLAASAFPKMAAPVTGSFRGTEAKATMESEIEVLTGEAGEPKRNE